MTSESVESQKAAAVPEVVALAKVVAKLRTENERLERLVSTTGVLERAKGVVMARSGCSAAAAHDTLTRRANLAGRTLMEECWTVLGRIRSRPPSPRPAPRTSPPAPRAGTDEPPASLEHAAVLSALGEALTRVANRQELAHCLREHLADAVGADAVMIYSGPSDGGLDLVGHAGLPASVAAQWRRVPPLAGVAAIAVIRDREAVWLEDLERDRERYLLLGEPPEHWPSRAWVPVDTGGVVRTAIGVLRTVDAPFTAATRSLLRAVARLCAGRLRAFDTPRRRAAGRATELVQATFDVLTGPAILLTPLYATSGEVEDFRVDAAAPESVDVAGRRGRQLVGLRILECYPTVAGSPLWQGYLDTLATGRPFAGGPFDYEEVVAGVPRTTCYSVRVARLGDGLLVSWVRHDAAERRRRRLEDVQRLGNLGWAEWNLVTDTITWSPQVYTIFDRDPGLGPLTLEDLPDRLLPEDVPALARATRRLLDEGRPVDRPFRITTASGVRHLRVVAEAVLDADGSPVEVHGFFQDLTARRSAELALVESERAVLSQRGVLETERTVADRLQHALLPLPEQSLKLTDLRVDVAYLPSDDGVNVGGDWYSALEMPDGTVLFAVGDVAGHGIDAVASMAQLRFTAKGMVLTGSSLTGALDRLNTLLLHTAQAHSTTATMVLARYDPKDRSLTWAQAGHPPPLLLRGGRAEYLRHPKGMLLGADPKPSYSEAVCRLEPGDHLLLYTDGLIERPREHIDEGFTRLADAALRELGRGSGSLAALLNPLRRSERRDDVCFLDIHLPSDTARTDR
ncbi:SpoIIE family protein phosphatase [Streptomyces sp. C36]|uniref:SpoIIE family protein phosphatase n=1 Tax=Streptomyces sp. C36 TaxID=3237122 RepID=UPI0034C5CBA7